MGGGYSIGIKARGMMVIVRRRRLLEVYGRREIDTHKVEKEG